MSRIDRSKVNIVEKGFSSEPFRPTTKNKFPLADAKLKADTQLLAFERGVKRRAVLISEAANHLDSQRGAIEDEWLGRTVRIERNALDGVPFATWVNDKDEAPMQLLSR